MAGKGVACKAAGGVIHGAKRTSSAAKRCTAPRLRPPPMSYPLAKSSYARASSGV